MYTLVLSPSYLLGIQSNRKCCQVQKRSSFYLLFFTSTATKCTKSLAVPHQNWCDSLLPALPASSLVHSTSIYRSQCELLKCEMLMVVHEFQVGKEGEGLVELHSE